MKHILEINGVYKKYRLGERAQTYATIRDSFQKLFNKESKSSKKHFYALHDVSFNVEPSESIAIIGRNGAGKSTLLKVLSKITPPTEGNIVARGRVASLLEVGTGFHPELTGKENIYLNGAILGLTRNEINSKYDEIVDFSGVEDFLDTPLKHYSSGMQLRLAFSVAAHLEPEILAIDEVLAVGDSLFQQKCIDKMTAISRGGRTVLFVSHNFTAIRALCKRAVVLENGKKVYQGDVNDAINFYSSKNLLTGTNIDLSGIERTEHERQLLFDKFSFNADTIHYGQDLEFSIQLKTSDKSIREFPNLAFGININDKNNNCIYHISNQFLNQDITHRDDSVTYFFKIKSNLKPNLYRVTLFLTSNEIIQDWLPEVIEFKVEDGSPYNNKNTEYIQGSVFPEYEIFVK